MAISSAIERASLICVYDERGTTLFQKAKGIGVMAVHLDHPV
jgi:hypothetical protein